LPGNAVVERGACEGVLVRFYGIVRLVNPRRIAAVSPAERQRRAVVALIPTLSERWSGRHDRNRRAGKEIARPDKTVPDRNIAC
jgi:hypothetical protein